MKAKEVVLIVAIGLLFCFQIIFPVATAHTGGIFTIIVSENGVVPGNVQMLVNDTARWINVDDRENITHRILVDSDSDGTYNGENDWDSGNLTDSCEHVNGPKVDENCNAYFDVIFNETALNMSYYDIVGTYAFVDIVSNGEKVYGNVTVNPDTHLTAGFQEPINEEKDDEGEERPAFLLIIAAVSGIGDVILGAMIIFVSKDEKTRPP